MTLAHGLGLGLPFMRNAGSAWTPLDLSAAPYAWWSADRADLITLSGSLVTSWKDVVAGYDKVQGVGTARPAYSATSFNGAPAVDYDGSDDQLTLTGVPVSFPIGDDPVEIWVVFDNEAPGADTTTRRIFNYGGTSNNNSRALILLGVSGTQRLQGYTGTGASSVFTAQADADATGRHAARLAVTGTGVALAIDGGALNSETPGVSATTDTMVRSGLGTNGSGALNGKIRHIVVTQPLSGDDLTAMWAWAQIQRRA